jgi:hypothetical protein
VFTDHDKPFVVETATYPPDPTIIKSPLPAVIDFQLEPLTFVPYQVLPTVDAEVPAVRVMTKYCEYAEESVTVNVEPTDVATVYVLLKIPIADRVIV